jgi:beta-lactamase class A
VTTRRALLLGMTTGLAIAGGRGRARSWEGDNASALARMDSLEVKYGGRLGVAVLDTASGRRLLHRADERFPLCSTFKLLAAAAVLQRVDTHEDRLDRLVL